MKSQKLELILMQIRKNMNHDVLFTLGIRKNGKIEIISARSCNCRDEENGQDEDDDSGRENPFFLKDRFKLTKNITYVG